MKAKVFYWKPIKWINTDRDNLPTLVDIMCDYELVAEIELPYPISFIEATDWVFAELNTEPEKHIKSLPESVAHTSMSVGDIVYLEERTERHAYICLPFGWKELS